MSKVTVKHTRTQQESLKWLADMTEKAMIDPLVRETAIAVTRDCKARDGLCELTAIFNAVKYGTNSSRALRRGVRYVYDPRDTDFYTSPAELLRMCERGACAEDCDGQTMLVGALAGSIGYPVGLVAYAPDGEDDYVHVYPVAIYPVRNPIHIVGLDTTVPSSTVGWEPPGGKTLVAWVY